MDILDNEGILACLGSTEKTLLHFQWACFQRHMDLFECTLDWIYCGMYQMTVKIITACMVHCHLSHRFQLRRQLIAAKNKQILIHCALPALHQMAGRSI